MLHVPVWGYDSLFAEFLRIGNGSVHSVFPHAVNLLSNGLLYTLLSGKHLPTPCAASVDIADFSSLQIHPGSRVQASDDELTFHNQIILHFQNAVLFDPFFRAIPWKKDCIHTGLQELEQFLPAYRNRSAAAAFYMAFFMGDPQPSDCIQRELSARMERLLCAFPKREAVSFYAGELVGAGIGLTPAGDDFLCGLLLAFQRAENECSKKFRQSLTAGVLQALKTKTTTDVSRQMLLFHTQGRSPRLYEQLVEDLLSGSKEVSKDLLELEKVGYSSGIDLACGVASGFRLLL